MVSHHHQLRFPPAFRKRFFWWGHRSSGQRGFQQPSEADDGVGAHPGAEVSKGMDWWKGKSPISIFYIYIYTYIYIYINISIMYQYIVLNGLGSREWYLDSFGTNVYTCFFSTNVVWGRPLDFPLRPIHKTRNFMNSMVYGRLVGGFNPLANMSSSVGMILPNWMENHKIPWFQTTNQ